MFEIPIPPSDITDMIVRSIIGAAYDDLDGTAVHDVRRRFVDVAGCAFGGAHADGNAALRRVLPLDGRASSRATVLHHGDRMAPAEAAMLNAVQARSYDFEVGEIHVLQEENRSTGHIPATVDLTALAVGEALGASGRDVVLAAALGGDLAARLATAEDFAPGHSFELTGTVTAFGAVAAAARLRRLDTETLRRAFGIVLNLIAGSFQSIIDAAHTFKLPQGAAARNAVLAVELAAAGFGGPLDAFYARRGYFAQYTRHHRPDLVAHGLGQEVHTRGYHKAWPGCYGCHAALEAGLLLANQQNVRATDVAELVIEVWPDIAGGFLDRPFSAGDGTAKALFNIRYAAASALLRGTALPAHYEGEARRDPELLRLIAATRLQPTLPDEWGHGVAARVHALRHDGSRADAEVERPRGFPGRELEDGELDCKFRANLAHAGGIEPDAAAAALDRLWHIDTLTDVGVIPPLLVKK